MFSDIKLALNRPQSQTGDTYERRQSIKRKIDSVIKAGSKVASKAASPLPITEDHLKHLKDSLARIDHIPDDVITKDANEIDLTDEQLRVSTYRTNTTVSCSNCRYDIPVDIGHAKFERVCLCRLKNRCNTGV